MKLDSKYFDKIRVRPARSGAAEPERTPVCAWDGCQEPGSHKAPRGRDHEGQYLHFCVDHVRLYNKSYNYFSGLGDDDIQKYLKDSLTGHRPTWTMGSNNSGGAMPSQKPSGRPRRWNGARPRDSFNLFGEGEAAPPPPRRKARTLEVKALTTLGLAENAGGEAIRVRYKALVKQYHPDANGGDRGSEDRLAEVIQAYKLLKASGFC
ncbi:molecular chaperone DnaJ [Aureimonas flava]|uniref:Molecular chaperone DnaJ n=1 Tax=Aureimonas flava TaxID=2320271 RepID=A0A3A1WIH5_9HYPH|nr:J domain-containing protein [Aureimonas flava]RIX99233.1 molecular chaperone DnaJ [Aureimonas flava]